MISTRYFTIYVYAYVTTWPWFAFDPCAWRHLSCSRTVSHPSKEGFSREERLDAMLMVCDLYKK